MIGKKVKYKYNTEEEGIILDKVMDVYSVKDNFGKVIDTKVIDFYLVELQDKSIIRVKCTAIQKVIC